MEPKTWSMAESISKYKSSAMAELIFCNKMIFVVMVSLSWNKDKDTTKKNQKTKTKDIWILNF